MVSRAPALPRSGRQSLPASGGFSSRSAFVLAAAGSAVGLGNIWKFPYIAGENGGGAFVLVYLAAILAIGVPALIAEIMVGRLSGKRPVAALAGLATAAGRSRRWRSIGWLGAVTGFAILSFYSVVAGWSLHYLWLTLSGTLLADPGADPAATFARHFGELMADPRRLTLGHTLIMVMTVAIVSRGVRAGIERATRIMVPALLLLLFGLVVYAAVTTGEFARAATFLLAPDFSKLSWSSVMTAVGHACFTLSVGMTAMMAYGAHLGGSSSIGTSACAVAGLDTLVALLAGLAIFPLVFANGLEPGAGPGLLFVTLPIAFADVPGGALVAAAFFALLAMAALGSTISVFEPVVEEAEERWGWSRPRTAALAGGAVWLLGIASVLSFNVWSDVKVLGLTPYDVLDKLTSDVLLPLGVLLAAVFVGWRLPAAVTAQEFADPHGAAFRLWRLALRYGTPGGVALALIYTLAG